MGQFLIRKNYPGLPPGPGVVALNKRQPCEHPLLNLLTLKDLSPWELEDGNYRVMLTTSRVEGVHHGTVF